MSRKIFTYSLITGLLLLQIFLGWVRYNYTINFFNKNYPLINERVTFADTIDYNESISELDSVIMQDPKWISFGLYTIIFSCITILCIRILFNEKKYTRAAIISHLVLIIIIPILIGSGVLFGFYKTGYAIAQDLKNLLQSPFLNMLFIALFSYHRSSKRS